MAKKKESVIGTVTITRSYARKLNLASHGGKQFETLDFGEARTVENVPIDQANEVSAQLSNDCATSIEGAIESYDQMQLEEEESPSEEKKAKKKKKDVKEIGVARVDLEGISDILNMMTSSGTIKDLKKVGDEIKKRSGELSKEQMEYLRSKYTKAASVLKLAKKK